MKKSLITIVSVFCCFWSAYGQCPTISVAGPQGLSQSGEKIVFRADVGAKVAKLGYSWSIDKGTIVEGQDTPSITVWVDRSLEGQVMIATVEISGLPSSCKRFASDTARIGQRHGWHWEDSFEQRKPSEIRVALDTFFAGLALNPTDLGFIQLQITHEEKFNSTNARVKFILKHAKFRKFDHRRLRFALELAEKPRTSWIRFLPGEQLERELPCNQCLILRGEDLSAPRP